MDKQLAPDIVNHIGKVYEFACVFYPNKHIITWNRKPSSSVSQLLVLSDK